MVYFTREPVIETVITSKEGYKLAIRNTKGVGHEEFFVDAVEVINLGSIPFYRSLDKPKSFIIPAMDYEIVEVKETKMALKVPTTQEKGIKIGGGREGLSKQREEKEEEPKEASSESKQQPQERKEKKRFRKRKEREEVLEVRGETVVREEKIALIPPPTTLISETLSRYRDIPNFAGAFFERDEKKDIQEMYLDGLPESVGPVEAEEPLPQEEGSQQSI